MSQAVFFHLTNPLFSLMETNPAPQDTMTINIKIDNQSGNAPSSLSKDSNANSFSEQSNWTDIASTIVYTVDGDPTKEIDMTWCVSLVSSNYATCSPNSGSPNVSVDPAKPSSGDTITFTIKN
jgi:hypothetical protein